MQIQIECNQVLLQLHPCWLCKRPFELAEARIIICNDQGKSQGEICSDCLSKGFNWLSDCFEQLNQSEKTTAIRQNQQLQMPLSA